MPGLSISSVYTWGRVIKAPPSFGQCLISGRSDILISSKSTGLLKGFLSGNALSAAKPVPADFKGFFKAAAGSFFILITCFTVSNVSPKINLLLSRVPNKFDATLNLQPITFSKSRAGPCSL